MERLNSVYVPSNQFVVEIGSINFSETALSESGGYDCERVYAHEDETSARSSTEGLRILIRAAPGLASSISSVTGSIEYSRITNNFYYRNTYIRLRKIRSQRVIKGIKIQNHTTYNHRCPFYRTKMTGEIEEDPHKLEKFDRASPKANFGNHVSVGGQRTSSRSREERWRRLRSKRLVWISIRSRVDGPERKPN
ncbi:hypothetical protein KPH14_010613 [Odynerus spinipes]|uniref:Uncharacterized protein n=1 Tax=Odynerus spinipes TaxID=1348599 RepID=A0AAD9RVQ1_9HYME|nr:hypothetical protein KPH14_010613 [Odynerus spinipes]